MTSSQHTPRSSSLHPKSTGKLASLQNLRYVPEWFISEASPVARCPEGYFAHEELPSPHSGTLTPAQRTIYPTTRNL